jgi:asparagine synthase (glutamine-hydrolysing)
VADFLGTTHHEVVSTEHEFLEAIEHVIYTLGTFDVTTIRASVPQWLLCQYIKQHSDVKVIFSGEYADEQNLSYLYGINAPNAEEFQKESLQLIENIGYFDNLRTDHCVANAGIEARLPFADKYFMSFIMSLPAELKMFNDTKIEKYLLRKAFQNENLIPDSVLNRRKNGFSDAVSQKSRSWSEIIKEYVDKLVTDEEYLNNKDKYQFCPPKTKEAYYFRKIYTSFYPSSQYNLCPFYWMPKWVGNINDPSARFLSCYQAD